MDGLTHGGLVQDLDVVWPRELPLDEHVPHRVERRHFPVAVPHTVDVTENGNYKYFFISRF